MGVWIFIEDQKTEISNLICTICSTVIYNTLYWAFLIAGTGRSLYFLIYAFISLLHNIAITQCTFELKMFIKRKAEEDQSAVDEVNDAMLSNPKQFFCIEKTETHDYCVFFLVVQNFILIVNF